MNYIGQAIGILAIAVSFLIYQQKSRGRMVAVKLVTDFLWVAHHLLILSYPAAATTSVSVLRELLFLPEKSVKHRRVLVPLFSAFFIGAALAAWKDVFSAFPAIASCLTTVAFGSKRIKMIRIFTLCASVSMMTYAVHYLSVPTMINETLVQGSIIIAFIRDGKKIKETE